LSPTDQTALETMMGDVAGSLARQIVADAEGAGHLIQIDVRGLRTTPEAARIAKTIANDALVKTAIAGADPNWGRIVSAMGRAGVSFVEEDVTLAINGTLVYEGGVPVPFDQQAVARSLRDRRDVVLELTFPHGDAETRFWTSDLTAEYVRLNSDYTT
jgi:glutamate N-acetyltransferase/amino-acid N-acetyltransferase